MEIIALGWLSRYEFKFYTLKKTFPNGHLKFSFSVENNCQQRKHLSIADPCHNAISMQAVFIEYEWLSDGKLMCFCLKKRKKENEVYFLSSWVRVHLPLEDSFSFFLIVTDIVCQHSNTRKMLCFSSNDSRPLQCQCSFVPSDLGIKLLIFYSRGVFLYN